MTAASARQTSVSGVWRALGTASSVVATAVLHDVRHGLSHGSDLLGFLVRDLDAELVLELHDQLDEIQRVGVQILLERRLHGHVALVDAELLHQDLLDLGEDLFLCRQRTLLPSKTAASGASVAGSAARSRTGTTRGSPWRRAGRAAP